MVWWESLVSTAVAFLMAVLFQVAAVHGMTSDVETWSGYVDAAHHEGAWLEYYEEAIYRTEYYTETETQYYTDSKGNSQSRQVQVEKSRQVFDHWEPETRQHEDTYGCSTTLGQSISLDLGGYRDLISRWGGEAPHPGRRTTWEHASRMISGDPNDYDGVNANNFIKPVTQIHSFTNRIKAAPTVFSFKPVPPSITVFPYPENKDVFVSNRLCGTASSIGQLGWDQLNARLGAIKKVNVIACSFGPTSDSSIAQWQKAEWVGGKKNDLVICFGGGEILRPAWCQVFGWSDSDICKHNIESLFLENPVNDGILPKLEEEIRKNYEKKNWHDFDYITIEPPTWSYWLFLGIMIPLQGGIWWAFIVNGVDRDQPVRRARWNSPST